MSRRHFPLWTLLGVVLVVALLVGGGVFSSSPPTDAERATAIESVIRCPSCEDLSVAVSSAPTAVTVRATVDHLIAQGQSDRQIEEYLVARYGSAIVLDPPTSGWSGLVWVLPVAAGLAGATGLVAVLVRRRRKGGRDLDADVHGGSVDPVVLAERRRFLTQSLADADAEYLAGDLSDADYLALRQRDLARLAALGTVPTGGAAAPAAGTTPALQEPTTATTALSVAEADAPAAGSEPEPGSGADATSHAAARGAAAAPSRRRGRNRWFLAGAIGCFAVALVVAVPLFTSDRLPGQTVTGSVALSPGQQLSRSLDQAATAENQGQLGVAAQLYQSILASHPDNEVALAQFGWLEYRIGRQGASATLVADARTRLNQATTLDPGDYAAHLYLGTILLQQDGNAAGAAAQFRSFLSAQPPPAVLSQAASILRTAFTQAGEPVPAGVPGGSSGG